MWAAADPTSFFSSSAFVTIVGSLLGVLGTLGAAYILSRGSGGQLDQPVPVAPRRKVRPSDRVHRLEMWREQYADPMLHDLANRVKWDPDTAPADPDEPPAA